MDGLNRGPKGRPKGKGPRSKSQPPKGHGKKGEPDRRTSGSKPPTRRITVSEEEPNARNSAPTRPSRTVVADYCHRASMQPKQGGSITAIL